MLTPPKSSVQAILAVVLAALAGCSGGSGAGAALSQADFFSTVTESQAEAESFHMSMTMNVAGETVSAEGDAKVGKTPADMAMSLIMDMSAMGPGAPDEFEMRWVDEVMYMKLGEMTDGKFAAFDLTDESNPLGQMYNQMLDNLDPASIAKFEDAVSEFEMAGDPIEIDNVQAQPYRVEVDMTKVKDAFGDMPKEALQAMPKSLSFTMYVGPDDLPRRMKMQIPAPGPVPGAMTMDYTDWGEPVDIAKPDDSEISDRDFFSEFEDAAPAA
jgi:hypothetical protein